MASEVAKRTSYTEAEIRLGLTEVALCSGNTRLAAGRLKDAGKPIPRSTLEQWARTRPEQYEEVVREILPRVNEVVAAECISVARLAADAEVETLKRYHEVLPQLPARDVPGALRNVSTTKASIFSERESYAGSPRSSVTRSSRLPNYGPSSRRCSRAWSAARQSKSPPRSKLPTRGFRVRARRSTRPFRGSLMGPALKYLGKGRDLLPQPRGFESLVAASVDLDAHHEVFADREFVRDRHRHGHTALAPRGITCRTSTIHEHSGCRWGQDRLQRGGHLVRVSVIGHVGEGRSRRHRSDERQQEAVEDENGRRSCPPSAASRRRGAAGGQRSPVLGPAQGFQPRLSLGDRLA